MRNEMESKLALEEVFNLVSKNNDSSSAKAFGISIEALVIDKEFMTDEKSGTITTAKEIGRGPDIYDLIENINNDKKQSNYDSIALLTTGWAAPLNNDGGVDCAPSEHKNRRRVTLMSIVEMKEKEISSVLKFDDEDELIFDFGNATGSLSQAILSLAE